jgi:hypothetical protein
VLFARNLVVNSHRADEDEAPDASLVHRRHDAFGLPLEIAGEVGVDDVLSGHGLFQLGGIQDVALDDAGTTGIDVARPVRFAQVERQTDTCLLQEKVNGVTGDTSVRTKDQYVAHVRPFGNQPGANPSCVTRPTRSLRGVRKVHDCNETRGYSAVIATRKPILIPR